MRMPNRFAYRRSFFSIVLPCVNPFKWRSAWIKRRPRNARGGTPNKGASCAACARSKMISPECSESGKESTFVDLSFPRWIRFNFRDMDGLTHTTDSSYTGPRIAFFIWKYGKRGSLRVLFCENETVDVFLTSVYPFSFVYLLSPI